MLERSASGRLKRSGDSEKIFSQQMEKEESTEKKRITLETEEALSALYLQHKKDEDVKALFGIFNNNANKKRTPPEYVFNADKLGDAINKGKGIREFCSEDKKLYKKMGEILDEFGRIQETQNGKISELEKRLDESKEGREKSIREAEEKFNELKEKPRRSVSFSGTLLSKRASASQIKQKE